MDTIQCSTICFLQQTHFRVKDTHRLKMKKWRDIPLQILNKNMSGYLLQTKYISS